jgi:putative hydrolase of HD superfamily
MDAALDGKLAFLRAAEQLKGTLRSGFTAEGRQESVAEHSWRLALMAILFADEMPGVDHGKLVRMLLIHDLGEALHGDIPAPLQQKAGGKAHDERADFKLLIAPLPVSMQADFLALWDEYEAAESPEARLAKGLDKLETILQHTQGRNPSDFDYAFNLDYGRRHTAGHPLLEALRTRLDAETRRLSAERQDVGRPLPA